MCELRNAQAREQETQKMSQKKRAPGRLTNIQEAHGE